jgi:hypothetical protein
MAASMLWSSARANVLSAMGPQSIKASMSFMISAPIEARVTAARTRFFTPKRLL